LQNRNQQLDQLVAELSMLIAGVNIPIVHLDRERRLRRFSPAAQAAFNLIPSDVGREFSQINPPMALPDLDALIGAVLDRGMVEEREVQDHAGHWYSLRLRPLSSPGRRSDGVLLALVDIDASKRNVAAIVETISEPLLMLDPHFRVLVANPAFYRTFRVSPGETQDTLLFDLGSGQWDAPELHRLLEEVLPQQQRFKDLRIEHEFPLVGRKVFLLSGQQIVGKGIGIQSILLVFRDVTEEESAATERVRDAREQENQRIAHELHDLSSEGLAGLGIDLARLAELVSTAPDEAERGPMAAQAKVQGLALSTHELSRRIHPSVLSDLGLTKALTGECEAFEDRYAVPVSFRSTRPMDDLPEAVALCLYRVVQEALRNIARHAGADRISIRLEETAGEVRLSVRDTGAGFDVDTASARGGLGLLGMSDRVAAVGGSFSVESAAGKGTTIKVAIPLERPPAPPRAPRKSGGAGAVAAHAGGRHKQRTS
jgi:two-component system CheB/CheR fusion protein